ncbi:MAG TPA: glycosyltransferase family A protein [Thermoleophilaceae bacterium]|nr:glycosyltransferase family A protein [Thermoleophilaceae bacterium]
MNLAVVCCFLNEEAYLRRSLPSIAAQSEPPDELLLVDDGSTDGSLAAAEDFAREHAWARVESRPPRPAERDRLADAAEIRAFSWAVERLGPGWEAVGKLDADMELTPEVMAAVRREFEAEPELGMTGPFIAEAGADGITARKPCGPDHVEGSTKFYRRECFDAIAPLPPFLGWDTIDESRARLRGWRTRSFATPGGDPLHMRPMGAHDGRLRAFRRWGLCAYAYGAHPAHVVAYSGRLARRRPHVLGGLAYLAGWAGAALRRVPRAEPELREFVRRDQWRRMTSRLRRRPVAGGVGG